jgi:hypothetical protein
MVVGMRRLLVELRNAGFIALGILSAGMGLKGFLLSSNFIDGGVTSVSMLLAKTTGLPLAGVLVGPRTGRAVRRQVPPGWSTQGSSGPGISASREALSCLFHLRRAGA